uniref:Wax synthase domain-containing protein n=1 Tax=Oryza barthii TaxID=65489 RepID=A0A0D3F504_9ORYZ
MRHAVPLATTVAMLYARLAASLTGPGPRRLAALLPAMALLPGASASRPPPAAPAATFKFVVSSAIKVGAMAAIVRVLHAKEEMHRYAAFSLNAVFMYCFLDVVLPALGAAGAGVLAAFLVSGLMHEVVILYLTSRAPTGRVTAFFALHGVCVCAERWWCARQHKREARPQLPRAVAAPLVLGFVAGTAFWLFFPAIYGGGMDDLYLAEIAGFAEGLGLGGSWTGEN